MTKFVYLNINPNPSKPKIHWDTLENIGVQVPITASKFSREMKKRGWVLVNTTNIDDKEYFECVARRYTNATGGIALEKFPVGGGGASNEIWLRFDNPRNVVIFGSKHTNRMPKIMYSRERTSRIKTGDRVSWADSKWVVVRNNTTTGLVRICSIVGEAQIFDVPSLELLTDQDQIVKDKLGDISTHLENLKVLQAARHSLAESDFGKMVNRKHRGAAWLCKSATLHEVVSLYALHENFKGNESGYGFATLLDHVKKSTFKVTEVESLFKKIDPIELKNLRTIVAHALKEPKGPVIKESNQIDSIYSDTFDLFNEISVAIDGCESAKDYIGHIKRDLSFWDSTIFFDPHPESMFEIWDSNNVMVSGPFDWETAKTVKDDINQLMEIREVSEVEATVDENGSIIYYRTVRKIAQRFYDFPKSVISSTIISRVPLQS